ncbi:MAG: hypothetical protein A4E42_00519 [Methanoregulaceae archaeon PtaU1.Bin222]|nr:MAG: hypothetical protein A4E42_00519 [Methanoregulaceae archaeon PtaU1.Bin222]
MIQDASQGVAGVLRGHGVFDRFADGNPQTARRIGIFGPDLTSGLSQLTGAGNAFGPPGIHEHPPVGFLLEADLDHIHPAFQIEHLRRHAQGASPLPGPRLRRQSLYAELLVVIGHGNGRIGFMGAGRAHPFILVVDLYRGIEEELLHERAVCTDLMPDRPKNSHFWQSS